MATDGVYWVSEPASVEFIGDSVLLRFATGDKTVTINMSRSKFRACVENGKRALDAADREAASKVKSLKSKRHAATPSQKSAGS